MVRHFLSVKSLFCSEPRTIIQVSGCRRTGCHILWSTSPMLAHDTLRYQPPDPLFHFHRSAVRGFLWFAAAECFDSGQLLIAFNTLPQTSCNTSPTLQRFLITCRIFKVWQDADLPDGNRSQQLELLPCLPGTCGASRGAYVFPSNVVLRALGLINIFGIHTKACTPRLYKTTCFSRGLLTFLSHGGIPVRKNKNELLLTWNYKRILFYPDFLLKT